MLWNIVAEKCWSWWRSNIGNLSRSILLGWLTLFSRLCRVHSHEHRQTDRAHSILDWGWPPPGRLLSNWTRVLEPAANTHSRNRGRIFRFLFYYLLLSDSKEPKFWMWYSSEKRWPKRYLLCWFDFYYNNK